MNILVTAGPTREFLDPVRFLSNRSTGKMGYALASAAHCRGHAVKLISGPVTLPAPDGVACQYVVSAQDMLQAVMAEWQWAEVLLMCAAVADWRPRQKAMQKCKKEVMQHTLELERTTDILEEVQSMRMPGQYVVGFAAETECLEEYARRKLERKGLDLIVLNDVSRTDAGFAVDTNAVTLIGKSGPDTVLPLMAKDAVAVKVLERVESDCQRIKLHPCC